MSQMRLKYQLLSIFFLLLCSLCLIAIKPSTQQIINKISSENNSTHELTIIDFSHYNKPIYVNYSVLNITVLFKGPEVNLSRVYAHYSPNLINWTTVELTKIKDLRVNQATYYCLIGPLRYAGQHFLKINATRINVELASITTRFIVSNIDGVIFLDFSYKLKTESDNKEYADVFINALGSDIKASSILVTTDQKDDTFKPYKMNLINNTNTTYKAILGPINIWQSLIRLTFMANNSDDSLFTNANYFILKGATVIREDFWRGRFPAIIVSGVVMIAMTIIFIMHRRSPPANYE